MLDGRRKQKSRGTRARFSSRFLPLRSFHSVDPTGKREVKLISSFVARRTKKKKKKRSDLRLINPSLSCGPIFTRLIRARVFHSVPYGRAWDAAIVGGPSRRWPPIFHGERELLCCGLIDLSEQLNYRVVDKGSSCDVTA